MNLLLNLVNLMIALNKKLWETSIEDFKKLYDKDPETEKDWSRITAIYIRHGGEFSNQESIIPTSIKENLFKEGVLDSIKREVKKIFKSPITIGIILYFLNNLLKKGK